MLLYNRAAIQFQYVPSHFLKHPVLTCAGSRSIWSEQVTQTYGIDSIQVFIVAYGENYKHFKFRREKKIELINNWTSNIFNIKDVFIKNELKTYKLY